MKNREEQLEIEKKFSKESLFEELAVQTDMFYDQIDDKTISIAEKIVGGDPYRILSAMIILIGSPERDKKIQYGDFHREVEVESLIKGLEKYVNLPLHEDRMNKAMELVAKLDTILYDIEYKVFMEDGDTWTVPYAQVFFSLDIKSAILPHFTTYKLPMLCTPRKWDQYEGGYLLGNIKPGLNRADCSQPQNIFDVLDRSAKQRYRLIDKANPEDLYQYVYRKMIKKYSIRKSSEIAQIMAQSADFAIGEMRGREFHFEWRFDFRGRKYCSGYDINWQGDSYRKACLMPVFEHKQEVDKVWRAINIANEAGFDKLSFNDRVKKGNEIKVEDLCPIEQLGAIKAIEEPQPIVRLDATQQALQLYSVLLGCKTVGKLCNIASGTTLADAYLSLAKSLNTTFGKDLFTRTDCKKALMVSLYAKMNAWTEIVESWIDQGKCEDINDFARKTGDYVNEDGELEKLSKSFTTALYKIAPSAMQVMNMLLSVTDEKKETYRWTMPNGFKVKYDVKHKEQIVGEMRSKGGKLIRYVSSKVVYQASSTNRGLAPNIIHSIDAYVRSEVEMRMGESFIETNHDEFAVFTYDCHKVRKIYDDLMVELLNSNLLEDIIYEATGKRLNLPKPNDLTEDDIRNSLYTLS